MILEITVISIFLLFGGILKILKFHLIKNFQKFHLNREFQNSPNKNFMYSSKEISHYHGQSMWGFLNFAWPKIAVKDFRIQLRQPAVKLEIPYQPDKSQWPFIILISLLNYISIFSETEFGPSLYSRTTERPIGPLVTPSIIIKKILVIGGGSHQIWTVGSGVRTDGYVDCGRCDEEKSVHLRKRERGRENDLYSRQHQRQ